MNIVYDMDEKDLDELCKKKIAIWGAGDLAKLIIEKKYQILESVLYFIDGDSSKQKKKYYDKEVVSPHCFMNNYEDIDSIIVATAYMHDILCLLKQCCFNKKIYVGVNFMFETPFKYEILERNIDEIKSFMSDKESKEIVEKIFYKRKNKIVDYSDIYEKEQYFNKKIVPVEKDAVFVDGGAFNGDSIFEFIEFQKGIYKKIISFEMDKKNYDSINRKELDDRTIIYNLGLWNERKKMYYKCNSSASKLGEGDNYVECITLDEIIKEEYVSFIKLDIEGAEYNALLGAEGCIKRCEPNLAICIYHKPEDIWTITKLLKSWLPNHNFYMRHHSSSFVDTVLYVIKNK